LLIPPYVLAAAWFAVLGSTGWIGHFLSIEGRARRRRQDVATGF
jgi:ABC-type Fe3+ transport system permease subunit